MKERIEIALIIASVLIMNAWWAYVVRRPGKHRGEGRAVRGAGDPSVNTHRYAAHWWAW